MEPYNICVAHLHCVILVFFVLIHGGDELIISILTIGVHVPQ